MPRLRPSAVRSPYYMSRRREMKKRRHMAYQVRVRAIVPAMICIITPTTHPSIIIIVQKMCGFSRNAITLTDTICLLLALFGPAEMSAVRSLPGVNRTSSGRHDLAENDPGSEICSFTDVKI
jgi:hypothetical protein